MIGDLSKRCKMFLPLKKIPSSEIHCQLIEIYAGNVMSRKQVWFSSKEFNKGKTNVLYSPDFAPKFSSLLTVGSSPYQKQGEGGYCIGHVEFKSFSLKNITSEFIALKKGRIKIKEKAYRTWIFRTSIFTLNCSGLSSCF